jgi:hypothetical protein
MGNGGLRGGFAEEGRKGQAERERERERERRRGGMGMWHN